MAETRVMYDEKRLIPAPLVTINKEYQRSSDGQKIGVNFVLTITGTLFAYKGSPLSDGSFHSAGGYPSDEDISTEARLGAIERKMEALRQLFATDGLELEFQSGDGSAPIKCNPEFQSLNFPEGIWHDTANYTIVLNTPTLSGGTLAGDNEENLAEFDYNISAASEAWSLQSNEQAQGVSLSLGEGSNPPSNNDSKTYTLTHTVTATGKKTFNNDGSVENLGWQNARNFVASRAGYDSSPISQALLPISAGPYEPTPDPPGSGPTPPVNPAKPYNHTRSITYDEVAGTYSLVEVWTIANQDYLEQFTVSTVESADTGLKRVTIAGTVSGLYERSADSVSDTVTGYENADAAWNTIEGLLITRAQNYSGISVLNTIPLNATTGRNPANGIINYSYEYDTRPSNIVTGSKSEVISVNNNWGVNIFAEQIIIGRALGPKLQDIGTYNSLKRGLSLEIVFDPVSGMPSNLTSGFTGPSSAAMSDIQNIVDAANPSTQSLTTFVSNQTDNWNPLTGRYSYSVEWTYENDTGTSAAGLKTNS